MSIEFDYYSGDPGDEHQLRAYVEANGVGAEDAIPVRTFETGATRDTDEGKLDYEGFLSPWAMQRFAIYMHKHRHQSNGELRSSDNWQKGIPLDAYMKSGWRHFFDWWSAHRDKAVTEEDLLDALCALTFNVQGYMHELLKVRLGKAPVR